MTNIIMAAFLLIVGGADMSVYFANGSTSGNLMFWSGWCICLGLVFVGWAIEEYMEDK